MGSSPTHDFDRVGHFAAESHVDRSILGPRPFIRTNVEGTCVLLEAAADHGQGRADGRVFLHVSTDEVYGSLEPDEPAFTETSPYQPNSPYSASRLQPTTGAGPGGTRSACRSS